jgi:hypothetical protein
LYPDGTVISPEQLARAAGPRAGIVGNLMVRAGMVYHAYHCSSEASGIAAKHRQRLDN